MTLYLEEDLPPRSTDPSDVVQFTPSNIQRSNLNRRAETCMLYRHK